MVRQQAMERIDVGHWMIVETDDEVSFLHSRALCRTVSLDSDDEDACAHRQVVASHEQSMEWRILSGNANITAPDPAVFYQPARYKLCSIDGGRKADALRRQNDGRIDANN